jgi:hypothetical protein
VLAHTELIRRIDAEHARIAHSQLGLLRLMAEGDRLAVWRGSGARDMAHWVAMRHGISEWKARRWIAAAHALEALPRIAESFASGALGIDKVVELTRFATRETEARLVAWACRVSVSCIRRRADSEARRTLAEARDIDRSRFVSWWWFDEGRRFGLEAELPAAEGALVARTLERLAEDLPVMPGEEGPWNAGARRADALVALASARVAEDADADRATIVLHAPLDALASSDRGCELEGGAVIHPETARRFLCNARVQAVLEDETREPIGVGRVSREPSAWMMRQLRYRDRECRFPACGARRFTQAHHVVWWENGGRTDLDNLVLLCTFHHKLVHEYGWAVRRDPDGTISWFRPDGRRHDAGPAPPLTEAAG